VTVHSKRSERHRFLRGQRPSHRDQAILLEDDLRTAAWKVICATAHVHWPAYAPHAGSWAFDPLPFMFLNLFLCMVRRRALRVADRWDFSEVYAALADFADGYAWRPEKGRVPAAHRDRHARDADLPVSPLRDAGDSGAALAVVAVADQRAAGADPGGGRWM
jgi:Regulator of RNA terminal phosphate cyclase